MENSFKQTVTEKPRNTEQKCLCVLCLDVSGSMSGDPIKALNEGLKEFADEIKKDNVARKRLELSIVTFDNTISVLQEPDLVDFFTMPTLDTGGTTKLANGVKEAIRNYNEKRPHMSLGYKTPEQDYKTQIELSTY